MRVLYLGRIGIWSVSLLFEVVCSWRIRTAVLCNWRWKCCLWRVQGTVISFFRRMIRNWATLERKLSPFTKQPGGTFALIKHSCTEAEEDWPARREWHCDQLEAIVVEWASVEVTRREFFQPHRVVVRTNAETTKPWVVYDTSARAQEKDPSLNDCLHAGPPLQNKLWSVVVQNRFNPVVVAGDVHRAFLQVRIRETESDALRKEPSKLKRCVSPKWYLASPLRQYFSMECFSKT